MYNEHKEQTKLSNEEAIALVFTRLCQWWQTLHHFHLFPFSPSLSCDIIKCAQLNLFLQTWSLQEETRQYQQSLTWTE